MVISGPSGAGKSTVVQAILKDPRFGRAVTATTRAPRPGERASVDYEFLTAEAFERGVRDGAFLEHAMVYGHRYGTPRASVDQVLREGRHCLLVVDIQGVDNVRRASVPAHYVFVEPPSMRVLEQRLRERATESEAALELRLRTAAAELQARNRFDLCVANDRVERAAEEIRSWVLERAGGAVENERRSQARKGDMREEG